MGFKRKFSEGDKAIVKETKQVVTVGSYVNRDYRVRFEDGFYGYYRAEKLEKYEEQPALFEVGDRVQYVSKEPYAGNEKIIGKFGTVVDTTELYCRYARRIGVEFDEDVNGHSCDGKGMKNHCWNVPISMVEKVKTEDVMKETDDSKEEDWVVGDEVVVVKKFNNAKLGMKGKVIAVEYNAPLVEFEQPMGGHDGDGRSEYGRCWWMNKYNRGLVKRIVKKDKCEKLPTLKTGMKVKLRDGRMGLVVENANVMTDGEQKFAILLKDGFCFADEYSDDKMESGFSGLDIVKVYANLTSDGRAVICSHTLDVENISGYTEIWSKDTTKKITKKQAETELSEKHGVKVVIEG